MILGHERTGAFDRGFVLREVKRRDVVLLVPGIEVV
jgi:hypothetical protein